MSNVSFSSPITSGFCGNNGLAGSVGNSGNLISVISLGLIGSTGFCGYSFFVGFTGSGPTSATPAGAFSNTGAFGSSFSTGAFGSSKYFTDVSSGIVSITGLFGSGLSKTSLYLYTTFVGLTVTVLSPTPSDLFTMTSRVLSTSNVLITSIGIYPNVYPSLGRAFAGGYLRNNGCSIIDVHCPFAVAS